MSSKDKVVNYPDSIDTRVALLEASISSINQTLIRMENKIDRQFDKIDIRFSNVDKEMKSDFRWLLSMIVGSNAGIAAIMAHGFHWF